MLSRLIISNLLKIHLKSYSITSILYYIIYYIKFYYEIFSQAKNLNITYLYVYVYVYKTRKKNKIENYVILQELHCLHCVALFK